MNSEAHGTIAHNDEVEREKQKNNPPPNKKTQKKMCSQRGRGKTRRGWTHRSQGSSKIQEGESIYPFWMLPIPSKSRTENDNCI